MSISIKCAQHIQMFAAFSLEVMAVKILHPGLGVGWKCSESVFIKSV